MIIIMSENKIINSNNSNLRNVFTIECKDIVLREFQLEDLDAIYNITLQPEIAKFLLDWIVKWRLGALRLHHKIHENIDIKYRYCEYENNS